MKSASHCLAALAVAATSIFSAPRWAVSAETTTKDHDQWSYVPDGKGVRPIARSISLSEDPPQDLVEEVSYRGSLRRYAQLRYGSENSRRVVIVVDEIGDGEYQFFVDADRDRRITHRDLVPGEGRYRRCDLATEIITEDRARHDGRQVNLRLGATHTRLSVATLGFVKGQVPWDSDGDSTSRTLSVRRIDGNANGLFADARDRLLLDLDGDGRWDAVSEQFAYLPVQTLDGHRYAVRSDRMGHRFSLARITGVGHLRVIISKLPESARVTAFEALAFSDDGSAYSLKQPDEPLSVPVGRYTLGSITITIDTGEREPWHFVFSRGGAVSKKDWISVAADADVSLEAIGETRFELKVSESARPGDSLTVNPRLYTHGGLLINLSCRGRQIGSFSSERFHNRCHVKLHLPSGDTVSAAQSGFA